MDINEKVERLATEGYQFNLSYYISEGYELFKRNAGGFILFYLIFFVINGVLGIIPLIGTIASLVISPALTAGFYLAAKKIKNGETVEFSQFFDGFKLGVPIFLVTLIVVILTILGLILLIIPGIYLGIAYYFATLFVTFHKMDFWPAMEASRRVISKNWFSMFGFTLVLGLINLGGVIVLGIGLLVTMPITLCAIYVAFEEIVGTGTEETEEEF
jgi:uncharacterized membrane protein